MGGIRLKPGSGCTAGFSSSVIVSPTRVSETFLILAATYPTSPDLRPSHGTGLGRNTPTSVISNTLPVDIIFIIVPTLILPSLTLTKAIAPL